MCVGYQGCTEVGPVTSTRAIGGVVRVEAWPAWGKEKLGVKEGGVSGVASPQ